MQTLEIVSVALVEIFALGTLLLKQREQLHRLLGPGLYRDRIQGALCIGLDIFGVGDVFRPGFLVGIGLGRWRRDDRSCRNESFRRQFLYLRGIVVFHRFLKILIRVLHVALSRALAGGDEENRPSNCEKPHCSLLNSRLLVFYSAGTPGERPGFEVKPAHRVK